MYDGLVPARNVIFIVYSEQNTYFKGMADNKKKEATLLNYLQAIRSKDMKRIKGVQLRQYKYLTTDINKIIDEYIQLKKNKNETHSELVDLRRRNQELYKQNAKLLNLSRDNDPLQNKKEIQYYSKVIDLFASDKLQASTFYANNHQLKAILRNLREYRQLKFTFCPTFRQKKNKKIDQCKQPEDPSEEYRQLKRRLNQRIKQSNQIHSMYDEILPKLLQKNEENFKLVCKLPQKNKTNLWKIVEIIQYLKKVIREAKEFAQEAAHYVPKEIQDYAYRTIQTCLSSYGQHRIINQSQYEEGEYYDYEEEGYQQELLQNIREKIQSMKKIIDQKYKHVTKPNRPNQNQIEQLEVMQNVITVLKNSQYKSQNIQILQQGNEEQMRTIIYQSMQSRQQQLQRQQEILKQFLSQQNQFLVDNLIPNIIPLSVLDQESKKDMQSLQNLLKQNISFLVEQVNKNRKNEQQALKNVKSTRIFFTKNQLSHSHGQILEDEATTKDFEIDELKTKIEQLQQKVDQLRRQDSKNTEALIEKEDIIKELKNQIQQNTTLARNLRNQLDKQGGKMKNIQSQKNNLEQSIKLSRINIPFQKDLKNQAQTKQLQKLKQQLIALRKQLGLVNLQLQQTAQKYQDLKFKYKQLEQQKKSLNKKIIQTETKHVEEIQQHNNQVKYYIEQREQIKQQLQTYKQKENHQTQNFNTLTRIKSENLNKERQVQSNNLAEKQHLKQEINSLKQKVKQLQRKLQQTTKKMQLKTQQLVKVKGQQQKGLKQAQAQFNKKYNNLLGESEHKTKQIAKLTQKINEKERLLQQLQQKNEEILENQRKIQIPRFMKENQGRFTQHLFTSGDVFDEYYQEERLQLIQKLEANLRPIKKTKLIYKFDTINRVNFHKYIDNHKHLVLVVKTIYSKIIAAYSEQCFNKNGTIKGNAFLMAPWNKKIYHVIKDKKGITFDDYFLIFGNSQIRIRSLESKCFSNFGVGNSFYNHQGDKIQQFLGDKDREVDLLTYQLYELQFQQR